MTMVSNAVLQVPFIPKLTTRKASLLARRFGYAFVPQILRSKYYPESTATPLRLHGTSWMDGLRGLAASTILTCHILYAFFHINPAGLHELLLFFFVVGGYGAAIRPLKLMAHPDPIVRGKTLHATSGSAFRRFFRLYLPIWASTFMFTLLTYVGCFEYLRFYVKNEELKAHYFPANWSTVLPARKSSLVQQTWYWKSDMAKILNFWTEKIVKPDHNPFLWTIREEFRASMHLYVALLISARMKPHVRLFFFLALSQYHSYHKHWEVMLFLWGAAIAQWHAMRPDRIVLTDQSLPSSKEPYTNGPGFRPIADVRRRLLLLLGLLGSMWLMSFPVDIAPIGKKLPPAAHTTTASTSQSHLAALILAAPASIYSQTEPIFCCIGVVLFIICMLQLSPESIPHRLLTNSFVQHLGHMFFALILTSHAILFAGVLWIPHMVWNLMGIGVLCDEHGLPVTGIRATGWQYLFGIIVACSVNLVLSLWVAEVFVREVDSRLGVLLKMIEHACFASDEEHQMDVKQALPRLD